jgi:hypothetical protein
VPYITEFDTDHRIKYPRICPFCHKRNVTTTIQSKYKKATWAIPTPTGVLAGYKDYHTQYPACANCARFMIWSIWLVTLLLIVPWGALFLATFYQHNSVEILLWCALGCSALAIAILVYRYVIFRQFRIGYIGTDSIIYYSTSKTYSGEFARLNHTTSQFRFSVFRRK